MDTYFLPKTRLGKWSFWLIITFVWLITVFQLLISSGQMGGGTFFDNLLLTVPIFLAAACAIAAFATGLAAILKSRERAILVFFATTIGFIVLVFLVGEILFPH